MRRRQVVTAGDAAREARCYRVLLCRTPDRPTSLDDEHADRIRTRAAAAHITEGLTHAEVAEHLDQVDAILAGDCPFVDECWRCDVRPTPPVDEPVLLEDHRRRRHADTATRPRSW